MREYEAQNDSEDIRDNSKRLRQSKIYTKKVSNASINANKNFTITILLILLARYNTQYKTLNAQGMNPQRLSVRFLRRLMIQTRLYSL